MRNSELRGANIDSRGVASATDRLLNSLLDVNRFCGTVGVSGISVLPRSILPHSEFKGRTV